MFVILWTTEKKYFSDNESEVIKNERNLPV